MDKRSNWQEFQQILDEHNIKSLYHFTDRENLESIIKNGGLFSWADCKERGISIAKPGGDSLSHSIEKRCGIDNFVHLSFTDHHPMMTVAMDESRICNPIILQIDPSILFETESLFSNMRATRVNAHVGDTLEDLTHIHFDSALVDDPSDLEAYEKPYSQAEVLIKSFVPLCYITNIESFGIPVEQTAPNKEIWSTKVTQEEINCGVEDEYGVIYSKDWKRLLKVPWGIFGTLDNKKVNYTNYTIKQGTVIIADDSFFGTCTSLKEIIIPDSVIRIGNNAFKKCDALLSVSLPESITHIGEGAFCDCKSLQSINLPENVTYLSNHVFNNCEMLKSISLPNRLTYIGDYTFYKCKTLQSIVLPQKLTHLGDDAFSMSGLHSVILPKGLIKFGRNPFGRCSKLERIHCDSPLFSVYEQGIYSKDKTRLLCFFGKDTIVALPNSVKHIEERAFLGCESLQYIVFPKELLNIGELSFYGCKSLKSVSIPEEVRKIGNRAFSCCESLQYISLPQRLTAISEWSFSDCESLQYVSLPQGLVSIGNGAFYGCRCLKLVCSPNTIKHIGANAFSKCESLQSISLPNGIIDIGESSFSHCRGLKTIYLPESLSEIGENAFSFCYFIKKIIIPTGTMEKYKRLLNDKVLTEKLVEEQC